VRGSWSALRWLPENSESAGSVFHRYSPDCRSILFLPRSRAFECLFFFAYSSINSSSWVSILSVSPTDLESPTGKYRPGTLNPLFGLRSRLLGFYLLIQAFLRIDGARYSDFSALKALRLFASEGRFLLLGCRSDRQLQLARLKVMAPAIQSADCWRDSSSRETSARDSLSLVALWKGGGGGQRGLGKLFLFGAGRIVWLFHDRIFAVFEAPCGVFLFISSGPKASEWDYLGYSDFLLSVLIPCPAFRFLASYRFAFLRKGHEPHEMENLRLGIFSVFRRFKNRIRVGRENSVFADDVTLSNEMDQSGYFTVVIDDFRRQQWDWKKADLVDLNFWMRRTKKLALLGRIRKELDRGKWLVPRSRHIWSHVAIRSFYRTRNFSSVVNRSRESGISFPPIGFFWEFDAAGNLPGFSPSDLVRLYSLVLGRVYGKSSQLLADHSATRVSFSIFWSSLPAWPWAFGKAIHGSSSSVWVRWFRFKNRTPK